MSLAAALLHAKRSRGTDFQKLVMPLARRLRTYILQLYHFRGPTIQQQPPSSLPPSRNEVWIAPHHLQQVHSSIRATRKLGSSSGQHKHIGVSRAGLTTARPSAQSNTGPHIARHGNIPRHVVQLGAPTRSLGATNTARATATTREGHR